MADPRFLDEFLAAQTDELTRALVTAYRDLVRSGIGNDPAASLRQEMDTLFDVAPVSWTPDYWVRGVHDGQGKVSLRA